jgi:hypothetical protein
MKKIIFFASFKFLKKVVGSGSGSISQKFGSPDPDPHQNVRDPQHWRPPTHSLVEHNNPESARLKIARGFP